MRYSIYEFMQLKERVVELEAENARLKARVEEVEGYWFTLTQSFKDATIEIERLREAQRWIPVEERLPEKDGRYMVLLNYDDQEGTYFCLMDYKGRGFVNPKWKIIRYWREIGELPEEGKWDESMDSL